MDSERGNEGEGGAGEECGREKGDGLGREGESEGEKWQSEKEEWRRE